ncbi:MAG: zinc-binding dehydrogenase [Mesorhizobium sp.]|uniref:alcohol dehydrogenase n=1 Tax=Mesorhizobium sp. TaxID=1871066 RepID=UPI000FE5B9E0|nr:alcohol dehydrogenase [Mesorhizobium sp.]RWI54718.1 MAG: zinc-binding dehydrogenase [Mesorhizobium sp.]
MPGIRRAMQIVEFGQPLVLRCDPVPSPQGTEVLLKVRSTGVCHTDLHLQEGYYDLGSGNRFSMAERGMCLPHTPGHEIVGEVVALGPDAAGVELGDKRVVYPWIGCGRCANCKDGVELLCTSSQALGTRRSGGFTDYILIDHPRYLVSFGDLSPDLACTYACSGITAYSALLKARRTTRSLRRLLVIGAGGVGLAAVAIAKATLDAEITVTDLDDRKLDAAATIGADRVVKVEPASQDIDSSLSGMDAVIDFVGSGSTFRTGVDALDLGGSMVVVGLFGGDVRFSVATLPIKLATLQGSYVGTLEEFNELMALARTGAIRPLPHMRMDLEQANEALSKLRSGSVVGRIVLNPG